MASRRFGKFSYRLSRLINVDKRLLNFFDFFICCLKIKINLTFSYSRHII